MTLEKAIKTNMNMMARQRGLGCVTRIDALKLDIEALKKLQLDRQTSGRDFEPLLPGETKEPPYLFSP